MASEKKGADFRRVIMNLASPPKVGGGVGGEGEGHDPPEGKKEGRPQRKFRCVRNPKGFLNVFCKSLKVKLGGNRVPSVRREAGKGGRKHRRPAMGCGSPAQKKR